jgi:hypothetical protein
MSMFNKRHYEAIATIMQSTFSYDSDDGGGAETWRDIRQELATMFARDNRSFQYDRFERACQPGANVRART